MSTPPEVDELPTKPRRNTGLKIIVAAVFGLILSLGLCQVGFHLGRNVHDGAPSGIDALGGLGFVLSVIALFIGILVAIIQALSRLAEKRNS
jgi:hypothetical protein